MTVFWITLSLVGVAALFVLNGARQTHALMIKVRAINPMQGKTVTISTGQLHYVERGAGPSILLIHGLGGQQGNFDLGMIDALAKDYRVVAMDRPGMGYSERHEDMAANLRAQAGYAVEVIDVLGLGQPLVVGHSLGGGTALALALDHPQKTRGLALLAPVTRAVDSAPDAFKALGIKNRALRWVVSETLAAPASVKNSAKTMDLIFGPDAVPEEYTRNGGLLGLRPVCFRNTCRDFQHVQDDLPEMEARYDEIKVPVALLFGTADRVLDHTEHGVHLCAMHPHFSLDLMEGAGHMLPTVYPEACADFVRKIDALTTVPTGANRSTDR